MQGVNNTAATCEAKARSIVFVGRAGTAAWRTASRRGADKQMPDREFGTHGPPGAGARVHRPPCAPCPPTRAGASRARGARSEPEHPPARQRTVAVGGTCGRAGGACDLSPVAAVACACPISFVGRPGGGSEVIFGVGVAGRRRCGRRPTSASRKVGGHRSTYLPLSYVRGGVARRCAVWQPHCSLQSRDRKKK